MSASRSIVQATTWREEWAFFGLDGEGLDLTTARLEYRLAQRNGTMLIQINDTDNEENFELISLAGAASVTGPVVRVTLPPQQTEALAPGSYRHECRIVFNFEDPAEEAYSLGLQPITVIDGGAA